jgi:hypothetical protein
MEEIEPVETISPYEFGRIIRMTQNKVRAGIKQGKWDFAKAIEPEKPGEDWTFNIIKSRALEYAGIIIPKEKAS